jgi:hypothetical protein
LAKNAFECSIELREQLKANVICDFADAEIRVEQQVSRVFQAHMDDVVGKFQSRGFVEDFAKMKLDPRRLAQPPEIG